MAKDDKTRITRPSTSSTEADEVTRLKTHAPVSASAETLARKSDEPLTALSDEFKAYSKVTLARTELPNDDLVASAPTLAKLITANPPTDNNDSLFSHLDRKIAEEYADKKVLKNRFALTEILGAGGMGNVYLAKDLLREEMEDSTPYVAIKVLNDDCRRMPGALQALQSEAKKAQALSHPNIVTVYDFDRDGDTAFITMEYIEGDELKAILRKAKMSHAQAMSVIERVARGLAYAHQQGFVHSDIKPANIFCGDGDVVKILDFGIAKAFTAATKETRSLADSLLEGALTPAYASLEMLEGEPPHPADDVYSLACMAYEMLQGRHPFIGSDGMSISAKIAKEEGLKVEVIPGLSRRYMNAIRKGLAFEREDRFQDAGAFIDAIKSRNIKKDLSLLLAAATITGAAMFLGSQALEQVVPSLDSLKPELAEVASTIVEADGFIQSEDVDIAQAHRLYSQAWELSNDLTINDLDEREKTHSILRDRMGKVSQILISRLKDDRLTEFQLRELQVALDFLLKDEISGNEKRIEKALLKIDARIQAFVTE